LGGVTARIMALGGSKDHLDSLNMV
jgi:hypothetical protein